MTRRRPRRSINESWLMVPPESAEARPYGDEDGQDARGAALQAPWRADLCFDPLVGVPFAKSAADRILALLSILDHCANAFDAGGSRTSEGNRIYRDYFAGDNALFSDSSDSEKHSFRTRLTFPHPDKPGESLFCTWHGKVRHMTLRLHFSWPIRAGEPVYVVYAGPKLTKQ